MYFILGWFFLESIYLSLKTWLQEKDWNVAPFDFPSYRSGPEHIYPIPVAKLAHFSMLRVGAGLGLKLFRRLSFQTLSAVLTSGCSVPASLSPSSPKQCLCDYSSKTEQHRLNQLANMLWHLRSSKPIFPCLLKITPLNRRTWSEVHGG